MVMYMCVKTKHEEPTFFYFLNALMKHLKTDLLFLISFPAKTSQWRVFVYCSFCLQFCVSLGPCSDVQIRLLKWNQGNNRFSAVYYLLWVLCHNWTLIFKRAYCNLLGVVKKLEKLIFQETDSSILTLVSQELKLFGFCPSDLLSTTTENQDYFSREKKSRDMM